MTQRVFIFLFLVACLGPVLAFVANAEGEPWEMFSWSLVGESEEGNRHYIARDSIMGLKHAPGNFSYYRKVVFKDLQDLDGKPMDTEVADMFADCDSGMMDTLSVYRYFRDIKVESAQFRKERGARVTPDTLTEAEFRFVCGDRLPRYLKSPDGPVHRGADPWR